MSFEYDSNEDQICAMMMSKVIKKGGLWEKRGQRWMGFENDGRTDYDFLKSNFGVDAEEGQVVMKATGYNRWADYGSRSIIPVIFMFVTDKFGVVKKYKVRGNGNLRDGWGPNPNKTELLWERGEFEIPQWMIDEQKEKEAEVENPKVEITEGKYRVTGKIISFKDSFYEGPWHVAVTVKMLVELEDGSRVFGTCPTSILDEVEKGNTVEFNANFKAKEPGFGIFSRPSKAKIVL